MITKATMRVQPRQSVGHELKLAAAKAAGIDVSDINDLRIVRRSIDARRSPVMVNLTVAIATGDDAEVKPEFEETGFHDTRNADKSVVIVGAGPAGLFAALKALELGIRPVVLERGLDVDSRRLELAKIARAGIVNPECNYCFGEGGAGAYSDGKLYTRSKKRGDTRKILELLYQHGASEDILVDAHPHIGSDKLPLIIKKIRETIEHYGGEVHFNARVDSLLISGDEVTGVKLADGREFHGPVVLATGHSARDVYRMLHRQGVEIEAKGLAIGCRLEHPQQLIDRIQYHNNAGRGQYLPPAEYSFVTQADGRGVYSFCMCPGGIIVPAASEPGQCVVNGMSPSNRGSRWANSGMVVEVHPGDFPQYASHGPLEMMALQEDLERHFYEENPVKENPLNAPAQRMVDFTKKKVSRDLPATSYAPGIHPAPMHSLFPEFISSRLSKGFVDFGKRSRGFLTNDAVLIGLESRTSSPVRVPRDGEHLCHVRLKGLYPAGEGAGYAGGIVSAAIDGQRCVEALSQSLATNNTSNITR